MMISGHNMEKMIMKKIHLTLFSVFILSAIMTGCTREINVDDPIQPETGIIFEGVPEMITASFIDTKTSYDTDGKFSWLNSDKVRLFVTTNMSTYSPLGYYPYDVDHLENDNKMAYFIGSKGTDLPAFTDGTYTSIGIAVYPESVTPPNLKVHDYNLPYIKMPQARTGNLNETVLTGVAKEGLSTFKFSTAMGIIKITVNNIPEKATQLRLYTTNKDTYPIDGDFMLQKDGAGFVTIHNTDYKKYNSETQHSAHDYIYVALSGETSSTVYLNLPVAEYPKGTLYLQVCDSEGRLIMRRTINKDLDIARNDWVELPALTICNEMVVGGNVTTPRCRWNFDGKQARAVVNQNPSINSADFSSAGLLFTNNANSRCTYIGSGYPEGYSIKACNPNPLSSGSGLYYMHYVILSNTTAPASISAENVICSGTVPFYYSNGDVEASYVGEYDFSEMSGYSHIQAKEDNPAIGRLCHPGTGSGYDTKMTLAATDDLTKGNIMLTKLYNQSPGSGHQLYGYYDATNSKIVFPYPGDDMDKCFFVSWNSNYFYIASCKTVTFSGTALSSTATNALEFTVSDGSLTHSDYLMMKYTNSAFSFTTFDAFVYGKGLVFQK